MAPEYRRVLALGAPKRRRSFDFSLKPTKRAYQLKKNDTPIFASVEQTLLICRGATPKPQNPAARMSKHRFLLRRATRHGTPCRCEAPDHLGRKQKSLRSRNDKQNRSVLKLVDPRFHLRFRPLEIYIYIYTYIYIYIYYVFPVMVDCLLKPTKENITFLSN